MQHTKYMLTDFVLLVSSNPQWAVSGYVFGESEVRLGFSTAPGVGAPSPVFRASRLSHWWLLAAGAGRLGLAATGVAFPQVACAPRLPAVTGHVAGRPLPPTSGVFAGRPDGLAHLEVLFCPRGCGAE